MGETVWCGRWRLTYSHNHSIYQPHPGEPNVSYGSSVRWLSGGRLFHHCLPTQKGHAECAGERREHDHREDYEHDVEDTGKSSVCTQCGFVEGIKIAAVVSKDIEQLTGCQDGNRRHRQKPSDPIREQPLRGAAAAHPCQKHPAKPGNAQDP